MNTNLTRTESNEKQARAINGWGMLTVNLAFLFGALAWFISIIARSAQTHDKTNLWWLLGAILLEILAIIFLCGHFTLQPNQARLLILFGAYRGTVRESGFWWANPFYSRARSKAPLQQGAHTGQKSGHEGGAASTAHPTRSAVISLRAHNFNSDRLKVNDKRGNPVEIAAVIVWRVADTAKAAFDVDDYESYIHIQSEAAIRHIASLYSYDRGEEHEPTLRESADEVAAALKLELQERLTKAGVVAEEARLTHLAYAPEIAQAMLPRQQAEAVIAARQKIVHGAVS